MCVNEVLYSVHAEQEYTFSLDIARPQIASTLQSISAHIPDFIPQQ